MRLPIGEVMNFFISPVWNKNRIKKKTPPFQGGVFRGVEMKKMLMTIKFLSQDLLYKPCKRVKYFPPNSVTIYFGGCD